jgi:hypothetical protein
MRVAGSPLKANPVLVVDANAVLTFPVTSKRVQSIPRQYSQIVQAE